VVSVQRTASPAFLAFFALAVIPRPDKIPSVNNLKKSNSALLAQDQTRAFPSFT
jgi:hypothetical protein